MAKKKRRSRQPRPAAGSPGRPARSQPSPAPGRGSTLARAPGGGDPVRKENKERARLAREAARRRTRRRESLRRALIGGTIGVVAVGIFYYFQRAAAPTPLSAEAVAAATAAGCDTNWVTPVSGEIDRSHKPPYTYTQDPPTSGRHSGSPLANDPRVSTVPLDQPFAVHSLEHASVIAYYRGDGTDALPPDVVDRLATIMQGSKNSYLAPYPTLPEGTSLAFAAWNKLLSCPGSVTADQAATIANGFITSLECTRNAPEPKASGNC